MSRSRSIRVSIAVLASSLLLNIILVSCAAKATLPQDDGPGTGGSGLDNAELLARFDSVMARLTQIEAKVDQQAELLNQQAAADAQQTLTIGARIDTLESTITTTATDPTIATRQVARVDSVLALVSYIADDIASPSWEVCGGVDAGAGVSINPNAELFGEAAADAGAWAGTGAFAGAEVHVGVGADFGVEMTQGLTFGGCLPLFNDPPPSRASTSSSQGPIAALGNVLTDAAAQMGLTESRVTSSLSNLSGAFQSVGSMKVQDALNYLPLPPQLASVINDPVGHFTQQLPARIDQAVDVLCQRNWGSIVSSTVPVACDHIRNDPLNIGGIFSIFEELPDMQLAISGLQTGFGAVQDAVATVQTGLGAVQTTVAGIQSGFTDIQTAVLNNTFNLVSVGNQVSQVATKFSFACTKINDVVGASLTIPNPISIGPDPFYSGQIFPFLSPVGC